MRKGPVRGLVEPAQIIANDAEPGPLTTGVGVREWALEPAAAAQLWEVSLAMLAEAQTR